MESLLQEIRTSGQAMTLFELAAVLGVETDEAQSQLEQFMKTAPAMSRDYTLFYTASGLSRSSGKPVSTVPGPLEEVQKKAVAQLDQVKTCIYCVSPKEYIGAPRIMIRKHRSLSAKGLERGRTYKTMSRDESIKGLQRRLSSGTTSQIGLSQLSLGSRQATLGGGSSASPLSTLKPTKSNISQAAAPTFEKKEEPVSSAPVPKVEILKAEVDEKPTPASAPIVVPPSPQVVEVKESPAKPEVAVKESVVVVEPTPAAVENQEDEVDAAPQPVLETETPAAPVETEAPGAEEVDAVPPPAAVETTQQPVEEEKKEVSVVVVEEEKENAASLPSAPSPVEKPQEPKKPSVFDALMKKPGTEGMLKEKKPTNANATTSTTTKKGKKKAAADEKNDMTSLGKKSGNKSSGATTNKTSGLVDEEDSEAADSPTNTQQPSSSSKAAAAPKPKKEKAPAAPAAPDQAPEAKILSVVNDELHLGAFVPVVVNPQPAKEKSPSSSSGAANGASPAEAAAASSPATGAKRTRDQNSKMTAPAGEAPGGPSNLAPGHKDIRSFFPVDRKVFSNKWERQVEQKMEKVGNVWTTMDVIVYKAKDGSGEVLSGEEYKQREAEYLETFSPQGAATIPHQDGGVGLGGISPGEAGAAATTAEEDQEAPSKKKQKNEPAKKKVNKNEAPVGQPKLDMFFKKK